MQNEVVLNYNSCSRGETRYKIKQEYLIFRKKVKYSGRNFNRLGFNKLIQTVRNETITQVLLAAGKI